MRYHGTPLRPLTTVRASFYAASCLRTILEARAKQREGASSICTPSWWEQTEIDNIGALVALKEALQARNSDGPSE